MAMELATSVYLYTLFRCIILNSDSYTHLINSLEQSVLKCKEPFQPVFVYLIVPKSAFSSLWTMFKFLIPFSTSENHVHPDSHGLWTWCHQMVCPLICLHYKRYLRIWWLHRVQMVHIHFFNGLHRKSTPSVNTNTVLQQYFTSGFIHQLLSNKQHIIISPFGLHTINNIKFWDGQTDRPSFIMIQTKGTTAIIYIYVNRHDICKVFY